MLPEALYPVVRKLLPTFESAARAFGVEVSLLLAIAWIESGFDIRAKSPAGALGLMQMMPATAAEVASKLGTAKWTLLDPATAVNFGAHYFADQIKRFVQPRVALAAYHAGPTAVAKAGGQVPPVAAVERYARNCMEAWSWFREHLADIVARMDEPASRGWRLICPPDNWRHPMPIAASMLALMEEVAERLQLRCHNDEVTRKFYLGLPVGKPAVPPASKARFMVPVLGATRANNGAYAADSGLDVLCPPGTPCIAAASGTVLYSEAGHTPWTTPPDTPNSVLIALDKPFEYNGQLYGLIWYTHLSRLRFHVPDEVSDDKPHVEQGAIIGWSGLGNRVPHLHFGVVADRAQTQYVPPFQLAAYFGWMGGER